MTSRPLAVVALVLATGCHALVGIVDFTGETADAAARPDGPPPPNRQVCITDWNNGVDGLRMYDATANGDVPAFWAVAPVSNDQPKGMAMDAVHGELFIANAYGSITVWRVDGGFVRRLSGNLTQITSGMGVAYDPLNDEIYVTNTQSQAIFVFRRTASGNVMPVRVVTGAATGLVMGGGIAFDVVNREIFVTTYSSSPSVLVFPASASGNMAPIRTITGAATALSSPVAVAVDPVHNEIFVGNDVTITVYARTANANAPPLRTITSSALNKAYGLAIDIAADELFATDITTKAILSFPRSADGNVAPSRMIAGPLSGLFRPWGVVVCK